MPGSGGKVIGVTAHSSGSLRPACVGVLEHALRLLWIGRPILPHVLVPVGCVKPIRDQHLKVVSSKDMRCPNIQKI